MHDDEPVANISGGAAGGGTATAFASSEADTRAEAVVDRLGDIYWQKTYGGQEAFECLVRTILSQNTSDVASQPAHDTLLARYGDDSDKGSGDLAIALANAQQSQLAETISAAGLYNRKSETLIRVANRVVDEYGGANAFDKFVTESDPTIVRDALLDMRGIGPKTADCVLLFAGGRAGVFPVDTHVHRIARRIGLAPPEADHETVRAHLEGNGNLETNGTTSCKYTDGSTEDVPNGGVPPEKCGFGHTATIQFGREYCTARSPACLDGADSCPLYDLCDRVGVNPVSGTVDDPAETVSDE